MHAYASTPFRLEAFYTYMQHTIAGWGMFMHNATAMMRRM